MVNDSVARNFEQTFVTYSSRKVMKVLQRERYVEVQNLATLLIYQNEKGNTKVDAYFCERDIWMIQAAIAKMYNTTPQNITMHIKKYL